MLANVGKSNSRKKSLKEKRQGRGLINSAINKLPFELHIPGYQYCGPGTKLTKRIARGDQGVNKLDQGCKQHDIAYSENQDLSARHKADRILLEKAKERLHSTDASLGEKAAALAVTAAMKTKVTLGMGCKSKKRRTIRKQKSKSRSKGKGLTFKDLANKAKSSLKHKNIRNTTDAINTAMKAVKSLRGKRKIKPVRVIPIPKTGGILPLIPLFAALGALGSLGGGAAAVAKAVNDANAAKKDLKEKQRHNQTMESIAVGKTGSGLFMKPYKSGFGLFLGRSKFQRNYQ